jgi:hypothetical protein
MTTEKSNIRAAIDKVMESGDLSIKPIAKDDGGTIDKQVLIRCTEYERERWKQASEKGGENLSSWIRKTLNDAATNLLDCSHPLNMRRYYPWAEFCLECDTRLRSGPKK